MIFVQAPNSEAYGLVKSPMRDHLLETFRPMLNRRVCIEVSGAAPAAGHWRIRLAGMAADPS